ncbi:flavin adenine dinucleotide pyrophosphatase [Aspergillus homomorphus CBS 101889]|uniref:Molybdopterin binding domain protein n=1 Tax=Aspergillus homomorphus (strain CBS 101889) TaxID=1450537 RepID=A0A395I378_ASPHC|nr:molybdopterin binding domain protein [Aspergillus homomorphus CBS 101889]RAL14063.1 molybdopterin binding domain protein [Aspergillus homomorphus CBS 101889]
MFGRLSQLTRQLSRPALNSSAFQSIPPATSVSPLTRGPSFKMTSSVLPKNKRTIHTAACLIIGDEVLGGKTIDTNSAFFAKYCFSLGIQLKRVEVIADDESEIIEAVRRMSDRYDFVVTSGGIGPTHDDITYASIAKAFSLPLKLHEAAFERMKRLSKPHPMQPKFDWETPSPSLTAKLRMVELPHDATVAEEEQAVFVADDMWVPIAIVNGNVHILPGVPRLFERLLEHLKPSLLPRLLNPEGKGIYRYLFSTPLAESDVAPYLTELAARVADRGVKVGSYPRWGNKRNTVTLVGTDKALMDELIPEVEANVDGKKVVREDELDPPSDAEEEAAAAVAAAPQAVKAKAK